MEIFARLEVKTFSRKKGESAIKGAAYRAGTSLYCAYTDTVYDFTNKKDVIYNHLSSEFSCSENLWNTAEESEKRKDATIQREFLVSLDKRLSFENQKKLAKRIANDLQKRHECLWELSIHKGKNGDQPHVHIITTTRRFKDGQFTSKIRELDDRKSGEIDYWRKHINKESKDVLKQQLKKEFRKEQGFSYRPKLGSL